MDTKTVNFSGQDIELNLGGRLTFTETASGKVHELEITQEVFDDPTPHIIVWAEKWADIVEVDEETKLPH